MNRQALGTALALLALGLLAFWFRLPPQTDWIGTSDGAAYANQGRALVDGDGLYIRYISSFYKPYDPEIWRPDDHWPPGMALVLAAFFAVLGTSAWSAKMAAVAVATLWLPLCVASLAGAISRRPLPAFVAGVATLHTTEFIRATAEPYSDLWLAGLTALLLACIIGGGRWMLLGGVVGGLMWWTKGSGLMALALLPAFAVVLRGLPALRDRHTWAAMGMMVLTMSPLIGIQVRHYGELASTQSHVAGFFGVQEWRAHHYKVYWGQDRPSLPDRFAHPRFEGRVRLNAKAFSAMTLLGLRTRTHLESVDALGETFNRQEVVQAEISWAVALLNVPGFVLLWVLAFRRQQEQASIAQMTLLYLALQAGSYVLLWGVMPRLVYPTVVVLMGASAGLAGTLRDTEMRWAPTLAATALGSLLVYPTLVARSSIDDLSSPATESLTRAIAWFDDHGGDRPVIMTRLPWQVLFHGDRRLRAVVTPATQDVSILLGLCRYYGVDFLISARHWPTVSRLREHDLVDELDEGFVWKIRWDAVPPGMVRLPGPSGDLQDHPRDNAAP